MPAELLIPLLIFLALLGMFAVVLRRVGVVIGESREHAAFRESVQDLAVRIDATLGGVIGKIDALRRQQVEPAEIAESLDGALEALLGYSEEARALGGPPDVASSKASFAAEIDRADRALQMVEHGSSILASASAGQRFGEAQTAIKRGYLNVIHAREAIARHAADIAASRSAEESRWLTRRPGP
jgi:hypothetical protein